MEQEYDYIIAGAGGAGLSLLAHLLADPFLSKKKILVVDRSFKKSNDRTWCFWEKKDQSTYDSIIYKKWSEIEFISTDTYTKKNIDPFVYIMIRGIDFYTWVLEKATHFSTVFFLEGDIEEITTSTKCASLKVKDTLYHANYIFNSALSQQKKDEKSYFLWQQFQGILIETDQDIFHDQTARLMDFRVPQQSATAFMYVLPLSPNKALLEYTLFSSTIMDKVAYEKIIHEYIYNEWGLADFKVVHKEEGLIPMSNEKIKPQNKRIIHIGLVGGVVKPSTGYAFQFMQTQSQAIVKQLKSKNKVKIKKSFPRRFLFYDSVLLQLLTTKKINGEHIFSVLFKKQPAYRLLKFLNNSSSLWDEYRIMSSVPKFVFIQASIRELFK